MVWAKLNPAFRLRIWSSHQKTSSSSATPSPIVIPTPISGSSPQQQCAAASPVAEVHPRPERKQRQGNHDRQDDARQLRAALKAGQGNKGEDSGDPRQHQQKPVQRGEPKASQRAYRPRSPSKAVV